jgi:hypothetical protein
MNATPTRRRSLARLGAALLLAALLGASSPGRARADQLDLKLNDAMPDVVDQLKKKGYKNVGTLRFQVKQAGKAANYAPPLSGSLATRVENLLVIHGGPEEKDALGVIHDASKVARAKKVGAWPTDAAERRKLFTLNYPLAWGKNSVKADAFLTGQVELSKDMRTTTLRLQAFDKKGGKITALKTLTVDTDSQVVRDLGYSFALSSKTRGTLIARRSGTREVDRFILRQVVDPGTEKKEENANDTKAEPGNVGGVAVEMLADGTAVEITKSESPGDRVAWQVASPEKDKKVTFRLKNNSTKQLAVVLRLNDVNTINEQKAEPKNAGKIVLDAGETQDVEGFIHIEDGEKGDGKKKVRPFKVLVGDEAKTKKEALGEKAGLIEVDVFEKGGGDTPMKVALRGLSASREAAARKNYATLRKALMSSGQLTTKMVASREVIVPDEGAEAKPSPKGVKIVSFERPLEVSRIAIKGTPAAAAPE